MLNNLEHEVLDELLDYAIECLKAEGCNEFRITVTNNNRDQLIELLGRCDEGYGQDVISKVRNVKEGTKMSFSDYVLLRAIKAKLASGMYR